MINPSVYSATTSQYQFLIQLPHYNNLLHYWSVGTSNYVHNTYCKVIYKVLNLQSHIAKYESNLYLTR